MVVGGASALVATLALAGLAFAAFGEFGGFALLAAGPFAALAGAGLGWVAARGWYRIGLWAAGVGTAAAVAPLTGLALDLLVSGTVLPTSDSWFELSLMGLLLLSPGVLVAGVAAGELAWRAARRNQP